MTKEGAYVAVPMDVESGVNDHDSFVPVPPPPAARRLRKKEFRRSKAKIASSPSATEPEHLPCLFRRLCKMILVIIGLLAVVFFVADKEGAHHHHQHHYGHSNHYHGGGHKKPCDKKGRWWPWGRHNDHGKKQPTKLPGGGRDWLLNLDDGTIASKHAPDLVLGRQSHPFVALVKKGDPDQLVFDALPSLIDNPDKMATAKLTLSSPPGLAVGRKDDDIEEFDGWSVSESAIVSQDDAASVAYVKQNFLKLADDAKVHGGLVLDVAFWNVVEDTPVNFVGGQKKPLYLRGGGRDWKVNLDGTVGPSHNPDLVLGVAKPRMVLVPKGSNDQLVFENLSALSEGQPAKLTFHSGNGGIGKRYETPKEFGPWHYVESEIVASEDGAITVRYVDGNYLMLEDENMVLDVSFWKLEEGNTVNFVGGSAPEEKETSSSSGSSNSDSSSPDNEDDSSSSESSSSDSNEDGDWKDDEDWDVVATSNSASSFSSSSNSDENAPEVFKAEPEEEVTDEEGDEFFELIEMNEAALLHKERIEDENDNGN